MKKPKIVNTISKCLAVLFSLVYSIPLYIGIVNAFKPYSDIVQHPLALPFNFTIDAFINAWKESHIEKLYLNTIIITFFSVVLLIFLGSMAAFVLSRRNGRVYFVIYILLISGMMVPTQVILIPSILVLKNYNLLHTFPGLILFNTAAYMGITFFLYVEFFKTLPKSIEESALIDGANKFTIYSKIMFPLLKPCTATVLIFTGMWIWNDFLPPLYMLNERSGSTITTGIYRAIGTKTTNWDIVFATTLLATVPMVILYILLQKQFMSGLAAGAIKG